MTNDLVRTPLFELHLKHGAKMVPFAGFEMPVQYSLGVLKEHLHTREKAGLFDVSHMGQVILRAKSYEQVAGEFEKLIPMDVAGLKEGRQRYGFFTNDARGIEDDIMFANRGDHIFVVLPALGDAASFKSCNTLIGYCHFRFPDQKWHPRPMWRSHFCASHHRWRCQF